MTTPSRAFSLGPVLDGRTGGELVQSLTYRESYSPASALGASIYEPHARRRHADAPTALRAAAAGAWALVSIAVASSLALVLILILIRVVGWLT
jgi:hypothetical protein